VSARAPARRRSLATPELDRRIADADSRAAVRLGGETVPYRELPERIARLDDRAARERGYAAYAEALEALNPVRVERLAAWRSAGDVIALVAKGGTDPAAFAVNLERFGFHAETHYYAALRRYLALIDIEQGDATEADLWHIERGSSWGQWFGRLETGRAVAGTGRGSSGTAGGLDGWRAAEGLLHGEGGDEDPTGAVGAAYATLVGAPEWLESELGMATDEVAAFADFAAFVRLLRLRRLHAGLLYELRLFSVDDPALERAYYAGIVGHMTGVTVAEAGYLAGVTAPFASVQAIETALLGAMLAEALESRLGPRWWRDPEAATLTGRLASAATNADVLAELGYDALDWRPVLRQIRTRLIGEMSGYGGPNITTRAGTRKV
jgi:hypothetical protein